MISSEQYDKHMHEANLKAYVVLKQEVEHLGEFEKACFFRNMAALCIYSLAHQQLCN